MAYKLSISVETSDIIAKIRRNLAIIGKRARRTDGESMFSDITATSAEEVIFNDLLMFGAETIVSELADVATTYVEDTTNNSISFKIVSTRWNDTDTATDLSTAITGLITNYLYNFCLARYLSEIHPSTGDKYPPLFGRTYTDHCTLLIQNIKTLAFLKREASSSGKSYKDI